MSGGAIISLAVPVLVGWCRTAAGALGRSAVLGQLMADPFAKDLQLDSERGRSSGPCAVKSLSVMQFVESIVICGILVLFPVPCQ